MGQGVSLNAFDPAHVRIYSNVLQLKSPHLRVQMIQTCLAGVEYMQSAKRAGIYSYLLNYISAVQSGSMPIALPGEQQQQQAVPRSLNSFHNPVVYPKPEVQTLRDRTDLQAYKEAPVSSWTQLSQTPQQKMVSYFSSCLEVLGIQEEIALTEETLKKAYKRASLKAHPDKGGQKNSSRPSLAPLRI